MMNFTMGTHNEPTAAESVQREIGVTNISTNMPWLDKFLGRTHAGSVVLIVGAPGTGKSTLLDLVFKANPERCLLMVDPSDREVARCVGSKERAELIVMRSSESESLSGNSIALYNRVWGSRTLAEDKRAVVLIEAHTASTRVQHHVDALVELRVVEHETQARVQKNRHGEIRGWTPVPELDAAKRQPA